VATAGRYLSDGRLRLLKFALSLRYYSPRIEMFRQVAADRGVPAFAAASPGCTSVVDVNSRLSCDVAALQGLVDGAGHEKEDAGEVKFKTFNSYNLSVCVQLTASLSQTTNINVCQRRSELGPWTIDVTIGVFGCPPTIVKFQPQLLKTQNLSSEIGFLEQTISSIA
jgi:hypothetical protein